MRLALFLIAALHASFAAATTGDIVVTELSAQAYVLKSVRYGTNIGLLKTANGVVLVDPMPGAENLEALRNAVEDLVGGPANFILNTHAHEDHTGGNAYFAGEGSALLADASLFPEIQQMTATSHTREDTVYFHKASNSIFVGDIYDTSWHPTFYAGGIAGFDRAIEAILALGDEQSIIVPGHGQPTGKAELRAFRANTLAWIARVRQLKDDGMGAVEIRKDAQINRIMQGFNRKDKVDFVPEQAFVRFIERTLAVIENEA